MKKTIGNVKLTAWGSIEINEFAVSCEYDGARFHVWLNKDTLLPKKGGIGCGIGKNGLYKNSIQNYGTEGYFSTRYLELDKGIGAKIVPVMLAKAIELKDAAIATWKYNEDVREAYNHDDYRDHVAGKAGVELLKQLKKAVKFFDANGGDAEYSFLPEMKAAIVKATPSPIKEVA